MPRCQAVVNCVAESKIQQLSLQVREGKDRETELSSQINTYTDKLNEAKVTVRHLRVELLAVKAVIDTHEQFLQKLPLLNNFLEKTIDIQNKHIDSVT